MIITAPDFETWLSRASRALAPHGRKAELARHLVARFGRQQRSWERHLSAILAGHLEPKARLFITISKWIDRL